MPDTSDLPAPPPDWLLLSCAHCGSPLKVRSERLGRRLKCPSCQGIFMAVAESEAEDALADFEPAPPPAPAPRAPKQASPTADSPAPVTRSPRESATPRRPVVPEGDFLITEENPELRIAPGHVPPSSFEDLAVDRLAGSKFRSTEEPDFAIPAEGLRVRKRKRRRRDGSAASDQPAWEAVQEAEVAPESPDGWQEITTATVQVSTTGEQRRKRFSRRRVPRGVEKAWLALGRFAQWGLLGLGAAVCIGLVAGAVHLMRSREVPPPPKTKAAEEEKPFFTTLSEADRAALVVEQFLGASTVEAKAKFVRFPEKVLPLMQRWYAKHSAAPLIAARGDAESSLSKFVYEGDMKFNVLTMQIMPELEPRFFTVQIMPDGSGKLDWETSVGWQPMEIDDFKLERPTAPLPFRVHASLDDYYNGPFADPERWIAVKLTYPGNRDFKLVGYADRGTPAGQRLAEMLPAVAPRPDSPELPRLSGGSSLIVSLSFPREGGDPDQVQIHEILHETWFLPDGPPEIPKKPAADK